MDAPSDRAAPDDNALFRAFPRLRGRLPFQPLGAFPTRVHRVEGLVPPSVELWCKREDEAGARYGGNKVRKLEFLLGEARALGAKRLATMGGFGSHHVLATAIYGAAQGFAVEAVVFPQPLNDHVREQILCDVATGATLLPTRGYLGVPPAVWKSRAPADAYWIAPGGSSVTGSLGFVACALELLEQVRTGELPRPDVIYLPLGSCGTAAGLLFGLALDGSGERPIELRAVRVVDRVVCGARPTRKLAGGLRDLLAPLGVAPAGAPPELGPELTVEHRFFGGAYGKATPEGEAAVARAQAAALRLEPTYTGKCMAALLADADAGRLDGKRVLFLHTYNGVDLRPLVQRAPAPSTLPPLLRRCFPGVKKGS